MKAGQADAAPRLKLGSGLSWCRASRAALRKTGVAGVEWLAAQMPVTIQGPAPAEACTELWVRGRSWCV